MAEISDIRSSVDIESIAGIAQLKQEINHLKAELIAEKHIVRNMALGRLLTQVKDEMVMPILITGYNFMGFSVKKKLVAS